MEASSSQPLGTRVVEGSFTGDGFCIVRGAIDKLTIAALLADVESRAQSPSYDGRTICEPPEELNALARTSREAYLQRRSHETSITADEARLIAHAVFEELPAAAAAASGWRDGVEQWYLMHEEYICKPPQDGLHFLWHRDGDRHLWCAEGVEEPRIHEPPGLGAEPGHHVEAAMYARPPLQAAVRYLTVWTALTETSRENGTLVVLPASTRLHRDSGKPAARPCGDECDTRHGMSIDLQPGDVCILSSYVFHTSRPNSSSFWRKVHCSQYSLGALRWSEWALERRRRSKSTDTDKTKMSTITASAESVLAPPLMFAVPCCSLGVGGAKRRKMEVQCCTAVAAAVATTLGSLPSSQARVRSVNNAVLLDVEKALRAAVLDRCPLYVRGGASRLRCVRGWGDGGDETAAALCARAGAAAVRAFVSTTGSFWLDGSNSSRAMLTASMSLETTLADFLDPKGIGRDWHHRQHVASNPAPYHAFHSMFGCAPADEFELLPVHNFVRYLVEPLDGPGLEALADDALEESNEHAFDRLFDIFHSPCRLHKLFVGCGGTSTQLHRDGFDNLYVCVVGRRTFSLANKALDLEEEPGSVSAAETYQLPLRTPQLSAALGLERVTLSAGDVIFIPCDEWHEVEAHAEERSQISCSINWYFDAPLHERS